MATSFVCVSVCVCGVEVTIETLYNQPTKKRMNQSTRMYTYIYSVQSESVVCVCVHVAATAGAGQREKNIVGRAVSVFLSPFLLHPHRHPGLTDICFSISHSWWYIHNVLLPFLLLRLLLRGWTVMMLSSPCCFCLSLCSLSPRRDRYFSTLYLCCSESSHGKEGRSKRGKRVCG